MKNWIDVDLEGLKRQALLREMKDVDGPQGRTVTVNGRLCINFCSNNYLGLAADPRITAAAKAALDSEGFGSGASRLVSGNMSAHRRLEDAIADMKQAEACLVFTSGYMANIGVLQAVCSRDDVIIQDKLNHASLVDGAVLSRAELRRYAHKDMKALQRLLAITQTARRRLVVTDSVFSMDGDVAPLGDIVDLARKYDAAVMVDEAHAFGVLGDHGGGLVEHLGLQKEIDIQMGTLSKAAGCFGAYVCGSKSLRQYLINKARSFIYTTGMPPSVAAAGVEAVKIIREAGDRRHHVMEVTRRLKRGLKDIGFDTMQTQTPIVPVLIKDTKAALALSAVLFEKGFFVQAIRPPTVPKGTARLRLTVTAEHTHGDVELLLEAMRGAA